MNITHEEVHKGASDVDVIPPTMEWWEYIVLLPYLVSAGLLVWYVSENMLVWDPETSEWGLPKPVAGAIMLAATWIISNFLVAGYYFVMIRQKLRARRAGG